MCQKWLKLKCARNGRKCSMLKKPGQFGSEPEMADMPETVETKMCHKW